MTETTNPAKRLFALMEKLSSTNSGTTMAQAWAVVLGLDPETADADPHNVYNKLNLIRQEVDLIERLMRETHFSDGLYKPYLDRTRKVVTISNISGQWGNFAPHLNGETFLALRYCGEILAPEPALSPQELQAVLDKVRDLRSEIENLDLSPAIKSFLLSQLEIIETGIRDYPLRGGAAIKKAFQDGMADLMSHADAVSQAKDQAQVSKLGTVWKAFQEAAKHVVEADKIVSAYVKLLGYGHTAGEKLSNLLGNTGP